MAIEKMLHISCDRCPGKSSGFDGAIYTRTMMTNELKQCGWRFIRGGRNGMFKEDLCPKCATPGKAVAHA